MSSPPRQEPVFASLLPCFSPSIPRSFPRPTLPCLGFSCCLDLNWPFARFSVSSLHALVLRTRPSPVPTLLFYLDSDSLPPPSFFLACLLACSPNTLHNLLHALKLLPSYFDNLLLYSPISSSLLLLSRFPMLSYQIPPIYVSRFLSLLHSPWLDMGPNRPFRAAGEMPCEPPEAPRAEAGARQACDASRCPTRAPSTTSPRSRRPRSSSTACRRAHTTHRHRYACMHARTHASKQSSE
jgi:hypothetical protein